MSEHTRGDFNKKTWKGRLGTGLNLYKIGPIDPNGKQTITSDPTTITQEGDAISTTNLNSLEQRIADEFDIVNDALDDLEDGTIVADKANKDSDGNVIKTTYATKTENQAKADKVVGGTEDDFVALDANGNIKDSGIPKTAIATEATDRANADAVLQEELNSHANRIANLEDKSQPFSIVYPNTDYGRGAIPINISQYAKWKKQWGKSRAWNQLNRNNNSKLSTNGVDFVANNDGTITVSGTPTARAYAYTDNPANVPFQEGHVALSHIELVSGTIPTGVQFGFTFLHDSTYVQGYGDTALTMVKTAPSTTNTVGKILIDITATAVTALEGGSVNFTVRPVFRDLTLIFQELTSSQITSLGVGGLAKLCPDLLKFDEFGYRIKNTTISGMEARGVNIWDEEAEGGSFNTNTGVKGTGTAVTSKNFILVNPSTSYHFKTAGKTMYVFQYDVNKNYLGSSTYFTIVDNNKILDSNCAYIQFEMVGSYGTTYNHDIQICDNSLPSDVKNTYHPYFHNEIALSQAVELKSAGDVAEVLDAESGVITHPIKSTTMGTGWAYYNGVFRKTFSDRSDQLLCPQYVRGSSAVRADKTIWVEYLVNPKDIVVRDDSYNGDYTSFSNAVKNVPLYYSLATPSADTTIPPSPTQLKVQPYGEISTKQLQSPHLYAGFSFEYIPDSPYLTKSDVIDSLSSGEIEKPLSANMGRVINVQMTNLKKRVKNLEQVSGSEFEISYPDQSEYDLGNDSVPTNVADYAEVVSLRGKTRAWNRLVHNMDEGTWSADTATSEVGSKTSSYSFVSMSDSMSYVSGHKYLIDVSLKLSVLPTSYMVWRFSEHNNFITKANLTADVYYHLQTIVTADVTGTYDFTISCDNLPSDGGTLTISKPIVRDVTLILNDWADADIITANIPLMVQQLPDLLKYDSYGYSLVDTVVEGVDSLRQNLVTTTEVTVSSANMDSNKFAVSAGQSIYVSGKATRITGVPIAQANIFFCRVSWYNGSTLLSTTNGTIQYSFSSGTITYGEAFTAPSSTTKAIVDWSNYNGDGNINTIKSDLFVEYGTDHFKATLTLPQPFTGKGYDESLCDRLDLSTGVIERKCYVVNSSQCTVGTYVGTRWNLYLPNDAPSMLVEWDGNVAYNMRTNGPFDVRAKNEVSSNSTYRIGKSDSPATTAFVFTIDASTVPTEADARTWVQNHPFDIWYEYGGTPESIEPIDDPTIKVQGNGTIETVQTQTPVLDNCLDVKYYAL